MEQIFSAYFKGLGQLSDPRTRAVILQSVAWTLVVFVGLYVVVFAVLKATTFIAIGFLEVFFDFLTQFGVIVLTWYLFPPVVTAVGSLLLERVIEAVEKRHYPEKTMAPGLGLVESIGPALKLLAVTVGYNLLLLPLFLVPPLWPIMPFAYVALNGYLLSREYFELIAMRRVSKQDARALYAHWKMPLFIAGIGFAFMLTIPFLNLITPVIATATMVHLFETWRKCDGVADKPTQPDFEQDQNKTLNSNAVKSSEKGPPDTITLPGPDK